MKKLKADGSSMPSASILGFDLSTINWKLASYTLIAIAVMVMGVFYSYTPDSLARTLLFAIGGSLVFYFFYLRWFGQTESTPDFWPPTINTCPDYLTYVKVSDAGDMGCVDFLGIAAKGSSNLTKAEMSEPPSSLGAKKFAYTSANVKAATTASQIQAICTACQTKGVTWEGVWDGDTCVGLNRFLTKKDLSAAMNCPTGP